jgi:hypothetical protein
MVGLWNERNQRGARVFFGTTNLATAVLIYVGVFQGLPSRYLPVDAAAVVLALLFALAGSGLLGEASWGPAVAWIASLVSLTSGLLLVATLALTATFLSGVYGPVGRGGALILGLVAALALPYLVALPVTQMAWLGPFRELWRKSPPAPAEPAAEQVPTRT